MIRCVSPVGEVSRGGLDAAVLHSAARRPFVRVSLLLNERIDSYEVSVEGDVVFDERPGGTGRVSMLICAVTDSADAIEKAYQPADPDYELITKDIPKEADVER